MLPDDNQPPLHYDAEALLLAAGLATLIVGVVSVLVFLRWLT